MTAMIRDMIYDTVRSMGLVHWILIVCVLIYIGAVILREKRMQSHRRGHWRSHSRHDIHTDIEGFAEENKGLYDMVVGAYQSVLDRFPTKDELFGWFDMSKQEPVNREAIVKTLASSQLNGVPLTDPRKEDQYKVYQNIIDLYNALLDRAPTTVELEEQFGKLRDPETTYSYQDLRSLLIGSDEYRRRSKTQDNRINQEPARILNDKQVTDTIISTYQRVKASNPSDATVTFLKERYYGELGQNSANLEDFIRRLEGTSMSSALFNESNEIGGSVASGASGASVRGAEPLISDSLMKPLTNTSASTATTLSNATAEPKKVSATTTKTDTTTSKKKTQNDSQDVDARVINIYNLYSSANGPDNSFLIGKDIQNKVMQSLEKTPTTNYDRATGELTRATPSEIEQRACQQKAQSETQLSRVTAQRNLDELTYAGERSSRYWNADNSGKLYPEFKWMIPQERPPTCYSNTVYTSPLLSQTKLIGTLLEDANQTQVGSMMPKFEFKELK
jgi:hypothetical protein